MKTEIVLDYLQKLQRRLPDKIEKKRLLNKCIKALDLTRDVIIMDTIIEPKNQQKSEAEDETDKT